MATVNITAWGASAAGEGEQRGRGADAVLASAALNQSKGFLPPTSHINWIHVAFLLIHTIIQWRDVVTKIDLDTLPCRP